ncbi:ComF family protein [bacterium SCSIO 12696]|nr:ComF family protein [bacterium SCSIO 12696]
MFTLQRLKHYLAEHIPSRCLLCDNPTSHLLPLCHPCQMELPWLHHHCQQCALPLIQNDKEQLCGECLSSTPPWQQCIAAFEYQPPISQLISHYKHSANFAAGRVLATLLHTKITLSLDGALPQLILPVPLHWRRQLSRGFNQSYDLARQLSARLGIACNYRYLRKHHHTPPQQGLPRKQRQKNLKGQFSVAKPVTDLHIALVDDVVTTGSTARAVASLLVASGAARVDLWCVARTPPPGH